MKKILLILSLILMFSATAESGDLFLDDFQNYRHSIRTSLGLDTNSTVFADTTLNDFTRQAVYHIIPTIQLRQKEFTFATTYKNNRYALDTSIMQIIAVEWFNVDSIKSIIYAPKSSWYQLPVKQTKGEPKAYSRRPSYYDFTDSLIFLYPVPIIVDDSIRILASTKLPDFNVKDTLDVVPIEYRDAVLKYATYLAARSRLHPLTQLFFQEYQETIANIRRAYGRPVENTTVPAP